MVAIRRDGGPVPPDVIDALAGAVAHRGPDGVTSRAWDNVAMIHAALHSTPESRSEHQPHRHPSGTWYVADARVDNRSELIADLGLRRPAATVTDLDLLMELDQRWGVAGLERAVGDFALVSVDRRGRLRAVRDHLGIRPLHWWRNQRWIVVASEIRQIAAHPECPLEADPGLLGQYLSGMVEDTDATVVRGIRRVPAAHVLEIDRHPDLRRYWLLPYDRPIELSDPATCRERCRDLLTEAVRCRLRTDGGVGAELTGGLDSTSVASLANRSVPDPRRSPIRTWSCLFLDTPGSDERPFIDLAVERLGLAWEPITSDRERGRWVDDDVAFTTDLPAPPDGPDHLALYRRAAAAGCRVVLTGHGGDHWFEASHLVVPELLRHGRLPAAWSIAQAQAEGDRRVALTQLVHQARRLVQPTWLHRPGAERAPWVIGEARAAARLDQQRLPGRRPRRFRSPAAQARYEWEVGGYEAMTRELIDRTAARGGVELRHPYLDRRVMEFACRLPVTAHQSGGRNRSLQRDVLAGMVPEEIAERRSKASFSALWLREIDRHLPERLAGCASVERGWIDPALASAVRHRTRQLVTARQGGGEVISLWGLVQVEALLRRLDGHRPPGAPPGPVDH